MKKNALKLIALALVCVMALTACGGTSTSSSTSSAASEPVVLSNLAGTVNTYDFFADNYSALAGQTHVFQTAEYAQFYHWILGGRYNKGTGDYFSGERTWPVTVLDGNYVFLIGGSWSPEMQAAIGTINDVAKEYGIGAIYNFDPHLDGLGDDSVVNLLADPGDKPAEGADAGEAAIYALRAAIAQRGDALAKALYNWDGYTNPEKPEVGDLNGDVEHENTRKDIKAPSLMIWNKSNAGTPVVGELTWTTAEANNTDSFKASVSALFDKISSNKQASAISTTPGAYAQGTLTARFGNANSTATQIDIDGNPVVTSAGTELQLKDWPLFPADAQEIIEVVTLQEFEGILKSEGNYAIIIGGLWCPNCHSTLRAVYDEAVKFNIGKIYYFDPELDSGGNHTAVSLRNNDRTLTVGKYIEIFNTYLTNIGLDDGDFGSRFDIDFLNLVKSVELRKAEGRLVETDPADTPENYNADGTLTQAGKNLLFFTGGADDGYSLYEKVPGSTETHDPISDSPAYASRVHYPCFIFYNKDHVDANGNPAPVIGKFAQLWRSGGGGFTNPMPNTFGRLSAIYGRIYEFTEYVYGDSSKSTATHNNADNFMSPKTNALVLESLGLTATEAGFDPRGLDTPIISRTYWVGLEDLFGDYTAEVLTSLVAQLNSQAGSNSALKKALNSAEKTVTEFRKYDDQIQNWINEKLDAPLEQTRLTARESIVPYTTDQSAALVDAYNAILEAVQ